MKAMILAAGLGSRLLPLTKNKPKALIPYKGKTLLEHAIQKLCNAGVDEIIVNVHHHSMQIIDFLRNKNLGVRIEISDESKQLLDTGGGLKKASWFFKNEDFFLYNVDIISSINLKELFQYHQSNKALATLLVKKRESTRYLLCNGRQVLCGWKNMQTGEEIRLNKHNRLNAFAFSGIHVINPEIFKLMPGQEKFSIMNFYLQIAENNTIKVFEDRHSDWMDLGKIEQFM